VRNLKNVAPQKQNAICKTRTQNAIALLNYLKRIAPQQLMLRTQVFTNIFSSAKNTTATAKFAGFKPGSSYYQALD
jgi:hypothetical protein